MVKGNHFILITKNRRCVQNQIPVTIPHPKGAVIKMGWVINILKKYAFAKRVLHNREHIFTMIRINLCSTCKVLNNYSNSMSINYPKNQYIIWCGTVVHFPFTVPQSALFSTPLDWKQKPSREGTNHRIKTYLICATNKTLCDKDLFLSLLSAVIRLSRQQCLCMTIKSIDCVQKDIT